MLLYTTFPNKSIVLSNISKTGKDLPSLIVNIKKETEDLLDYLKESGYSRRQIEKDLAYKERYIDQALSRGPTDELITRLKFYKKYVLLKATNSFPQLPGPEADLKQLLRVQEELRRAEREIEKRIQVIVFGEKGNSGGGNGEIETGRDSKSKKRR